MVYGCMQGHDGWVHVDSSSEEGTTFQLYLPASESHIAPLPVNSAPPISTELCGGSETVLVVDDTESVLSISRSILENCGYHVLTAWDGDEALRLYDNHRDEIDLVLTDMVMPRRNGRELLQCIRERGGDLPVMLMSGFAQDQSREELIATGFAAVLAKPFTPTGLSDVLRETLDRSRTLLAGKSSS